MKIDLRWEPIEDFKKFLKSVFAGSVTVHVQASERMLEHFPDGGESWLNIPPLERPSFCGELDGQGTETYYVIFWAWRKGFLFGSDPAVRARQNQFFQYLMNRPKSFNMMCKIVILLGLMTEQEVDCLKNVRNSYKRTRRSSFFSLLMCDVISRMKPFVQWTDTDVQTIKSVQGFLYSAKAVQDLRIALGYTNKPFVKKLENRWGELGQAPHFGSIFVEYKAYLELSGLSHQASLQVAYKLTELHEYCVTKGYTDLSSFDYGDWLALSKRILKGRNKERPAYIVGIMLTAIKSFFEWGIGKDFFTLSIEFPEELVTRFIRRGEIEYRVSDGLAFDDSEYAEQLVHAIDSYEPQNEIETLARYWWLIAVSCPARLTFIRYLDAHEPMLPMLNATDVWGLYSVDEDKAGNRSGQYPIIDVRGKEALEALIKRAQTLELKPIANPKTQRVYVHLFGLTSHPWLLSRYKIYEFLNKIKETLPGRQNQKGTAHSFRHYLLTHIAIKTGNLRLVQHAAGHRNRIMTQLYLRSRISKEALLHAMCKKFENRELSGRFYSRLIEIMMDEEVPNDEFALALGQQGNMDDFMAKFGVPAPTGVGTCLVQGACPNQQKCFGCRMFVMRLEEIDDAIKVVRSRIQTMRELSRFSEEFNYNNAVAMGYIKAIALLLKHLSHLGLSEEEIWIRVLDDKQPHELVNG